LKHTPEGGGISLILAAEEHGVRITIQDSGCGIDQSDLPYIFDRFYQVDSSRRDNQHAGLGLAITKRILALHGSDIQVESEKGQGTAFSFVLKQMDKR
jgi:signal transduction histidine kinase